ncbi:MAG: PAS domain-containing protein [Planctomycetota bacterium]|jgi:PAS domain S-box-containing protein
MKKEEVVTITGVLLLIAFDVFIYTHSQSLHARAQISLDAAAIAVSDSLEEIDGEPTDYIKLLCRQNRYKRLTVSNIGGKLLVDTGVPAGNIIDRVSAWAGLIGTHRLESGLYRDGRRIGRLWAVQYDFSFYIYLGILTAIALTLSSIWHVLRYRETQVSVEAHIRSQTQLLRHNERQFRQLAETLPDVLWLVRPDWNHIYYVNPAYEKIWGRPCGELYDDPRAWLESVVDEDRRKVLTIIEHHDVDDLAPSLFPEYRITRPDGAICWIAARAYPVQDESGRIRRLASIAEDVTDRRQAG